MKKFLISLTTALVLVVTVTPAASAGDRVGWPDGGTRPSVDVGR